LKFSSKGGVLKRVLVDRKIPRCKIRAFRAARSVL
jgi:hypothetical protein